MEHQLAIKLQDKQISYLTQVDISVTIADFYFPLDPRPLLVFVDGQVHLKTSQTIKDEETRTLLRRKGYRILEQQYDNYSGKKETNHTKKYSTTWDRISGSDDNRLRAESVGRRECFS